MTVLLGDTGKVAYGPLKTFTFQIPAAREVALGSSTLPNAEGATNQVAFTVQESDLPTITPNPISMKYLACVTVSGKAGTSSTTVSYRIFKNSVSQVTASSSPATSANTYWNLMHWRWFDVIPGDVLEVRSWANVADATIDYCAIQVYPANIFLTKPGVILKDITNTAPLTLALTGAGVRTTILGNTLNSHYSPCANGAITLPIGIQVTTIYSLTPNPNFGLIRMNTGDTVATGTTTQNHATNISYQRNAVPASLSFREVLR